MSEADSAADLREQGFVLLRDVFPLHALTRLKEAAERYFEALRTGSAIAGRCVFNRFSHSVQLHALLDLGCDEQDLAAPLAAPGLEPVFSAAIGGHWTCDMQQSWLRKKFAPDQAPGGEYHLQGWHQDGALGVRFSAEPGPFLPMTELLTCWIPLNDCGVHSPGLEFVRGRQSALLHFTELDDSALRQRFRPEEFWVPELAFGDGLVFLNSMLHRTSVTPEMRHNRLSVEYRIFPREGLEINN
jgi:hypothetical protein